MNLHNSSKEISMALATYCVRHPTTESNLACGRCGDAVCHRCVVHAPGGQRCPDCAQARPLPTFDVSGSVIARGLGAGLTIAVVGGILASIAYILLFNSGAQACRRILNVRRHHRCHASLWRNIQYADTSCQWFVVLHRGEQILISSFNPNRASRITVIAV